VFALKKKKGEM